MNGDFDYVILGAGSAGSVLAYRLTEDPRVRVLLLEAGGRNNVFNVRMPAGIAALASSRNDLNWGFESEPVPGMGDRPIFLARGRGLGGSSSINGMLYVRGNARDYDQWRQMGLAGWGYEDVLPFFRRSEDHEDGEDHYHGSGGPLHVKVGRSANPIYEAFIEAGVAAGHAHTDGFNSADQVGVGRYELNIRRGERSGALSAFLKPAMKRPNLAVVTDARVTKIRVENGRATGVDYAIGKDRQARHAVARGEVLLCAGAFQSPHILQLSGVGAADAIRNAGVDPVADRPGVGANLQDHVDVGVSWLCPLPITLYSQTKGPLRKARIGIEYLARRTGLGATNSLEAGGFACSRLGLDRPDIQFQCIGGIMINHGQKGMHPADGFTIDVILLHPDSRGEVRLRSADPFADPVILPNHLDAPSDLARMRRGVEMAREIGRQAALAPYQTVELDPGPDIQSDEALDAWLRDKSATIFHPVGTCRMGTADDAHAVVDERLRVRGVAGLRVIDASIMPTIVSGNTNAASFMIGEKGADMIRADAR